MNCYKAYVNNCGLMLCAPLGSSYNLASHQNNTKEHTLSHETQLSSSDFSTGWGTLGCYVNPHNRERYINGLHLFIFICKKKHFTNI